MSTPAAPEDAASPGAAGLRDLLPLLRPHRRPLLLAAGLSLVAAAGALAQPALVARVIDVAGAGEPLLPAVGLLVVGLLVVVLLAASALGGRSSSSSSSAPPRGSSSPPGSRWPTGCCASRSPSTTAGAPVT